jgi:probable rRNA maturation factor
MIDISYDPDAPENPSDRVLLKIQSAVREASATMGIVRQCEVSLSFVSPGEIRSLNKRFRDKDEVTDVLSFPLMEAESLRRAKAVSEVASSESDGDVESLRKTLTKPSIPDESVELLGDVVICTERAYEQGGEYGHGAERELAFLFVHGLLHLLGYDHAADAGRAAMRAMEEEIMEKIDL